MSLPTWQTDHALADNPLVRAPCCGREVPADMLVNVSALPAAKRTTRKRPLDYACDGCLTRLFRTGKLARWELAEATGADAVRVARLRARYGTGSRS